MAGLVEFTGRILAAGEDDGGGDSFGRHIPRGFRAGLEAALPMLQRQMSTIPEAELAAGIRMFARELDRIATLAPAPVVDVDAAAAVDRRD